MLQEIARSSSNKEEIIITIMRIYYYILMRFKLKMLCLLINNSFELDLSLYYSQCFIYSLSHILPRAPIDCEFSCIYQAIYYVY